MGEIKDKSIISFPDNEKPLSPEEDQVLMELHNLGTNEMQIVLRMLCSGGRYNDIEGKISFLMIPRTKQIIIRGPSGFAYNFTLFDPVHGDVFIRDTARKLSQEGITAKNLAHVIRRIEEFRAGV